MDIPETQKELLVYLEGITHEFGVRPDDSFTTNAIAKALTISRSLASQYLNALVRARLAVKVGVKPVYFFHRRASERLLQVSLTDESYPSFDTLLYSHVSDTGRFTQAVGHDLSLLPCIESLRTALSYPPTGLPILLTGAPGTGKSFLARLAFEDAVERGVLDAGACFKVVDQIYCLEDGKLSGEGDGNLFENADVLLIRHVDRLPGSVRDRLFNLINAEARGSRPRFILTSSQDVSAAETKGIVHSVPLTVNIPALRDRTAEERNAMVLTFFKREGRHMSVDILVSRGALRRLATAEFDQNLRGLRSCITSCCAEAYAKRTSNRLEINVWQLPVKVIQTSRSLDRAEQDDQLIDATRVERIVEADPLIESLDGILDVLSDWHTNLFDDRQLVQHLLECVQAFEDCLLFGQTFSNARAEAFSYAIEGIVDKLNVIHDTNLSHRSVRVISEELCLLLWPSDNLAQWKKEHAPEIAELLTTIAQIRPFSTSVAQHLRSELVQSLGVELDDVTLFFCTMAIESTSGVRHRRHIGIILSHGYSTASSMADAANRILGSRVFEAIDMSYDQQVKDVVSSLQQMIGRFSYCNEVVVLVDMGSLEQIHRDLAGNFDVSLGIMNNASTGLAVEIGAGLIAGRAIDEILEQAARACVCNYTMVARSCKPPAIACCADGVESAEKILSLVSKMFGKDSPVCLTARDARQLAENGTHDFVFSQFQVLAIIGTDDTGISDFPFIALEELIAGEALPRLQKILSAYFKPGELEQLYRQFLKSVTIRSVVESLTILDPERLYNEINHAVTLLLQATDSQIEHSRTIGLYVHLCCLVERLVTRNPIDRYTDEESFVAEHAGFIGSFRRSFSDISAHYRVEVPVSEIAYVYDYIHSDLESSPHISINRDVTVLDDE